MSIKVVFLGDVCGKAGRLAVKQLLSVLRHELTPDFIIVNGENAAGGYGITPHIAEELLNSGANCLTTGDHAFDRHEIWEYLATEPRIIRPLNFPAGAPGRGWAFYHPPQLPRPIAVINLVGRVFMKPVDCPFQRANGVITEIALITPLIIVDFHAEATAEKKAMAYFLDGRVSAILGTHTHIQTADEQILANGTAYITDVGMCGAFDSILGMKKDLSLRRMIEQVPVRLQPACDDIRINGVLIEINHDTGRAEKIARLHRALD